jgi:hypothetical protein
MAQKRIFGKFYQTTFTDFFNVKKYVQAIYTRTERRSDIFPKLYIVWNISCKAAIILQSQFLDLHPSIMTPENYAFLSFYLSSY